jgi:hypothetical protein
MKYLFLSIVLLISSCAISRIEYEYYYYSHTAYLMKQRMIDGGMKPTPNHNTVDGIEYTCACDPDFVKREYGKNFPDVVLVKKLPKGKGKVLIHY